MAKNTSTVTRQIDLIVNTKNGTSNLKSGGIPVSEVNEFIKSVTAFTNSIGNVNWRQVSARLTSLTTKMTEMADSLNNIKVGNFKDVAGATSKISDTVKSIGGLSATKVKDFGDKLDNITDFAKSNVQKLSGVDTKGYVSAINSTSKMSDSIKTINEEDVGLAIGKLKQFTTGIVDASNMLSGIPLRNISAGAHSVVEVANGLTKLANMSQEEYERASQRESEQRRKRQEEAMKFNEEEQKRRIDRERAPFTELSRKGWFTALFGEKEIDPDTGKKRRKEGTGLLGQEIELGVLKGLKGAAIGAIVGLIYKAITKILQTILTMAKAPLGMLLKMGKFFGNILKSSLEQAKTFTALIDLALKPFVLLFTLLFAPILAQLAPVLTDVIQKVGEWFPVIQDIGIRIADVIEQIITSFGEGGLTNFGVTIVNIIAKLGELSRIAADIFNGEGNIVDKISKTVIDIFDRVTEWFLSWIYSSEGADVIIAIGQTLGQIAAKAVIVFTALIPVFLADIGTIVAGFATGIFNHFVSWIGSVADWVDHLFDPVRNWLYDVAPWLFMSLDDVLNNLTSFFTNIWDGIVNWIKNLADNIKNIWTEFWSDPLGNIGRNVSDWWSGTPMSSMINNNQQSHTSYTTNNYQYQLGVGYRQVAPKEIMI